jgi:hypothetical protein
MSREFRIFEGDVLERLADLPADSFDACLCDPPYGLSDSRPANSATPRQSSRERSPPITVLRSVRIRRGWRARENPTSGGRLRRESD